MITEKDLQEAIAECQGQRNPTANTCLKLASYYIIQDKMFKKESEQDRVIERSPEQIKVPTYSYASSPDIIQYSSGTEFSDMIYGKSQQEVLKVMDELMTVLQATNPKLYNGVMSKLLS